MTRPTVRDLVVVPHPRPGRVVDWGGVQPTRTFNVPTAEPTRPTSGSSWTRLHPATKCLPSKTDALHIRTRSDSRLDRLAAAAALPRMSFHGTTPLIRSRRSESWREHMRRDGCALHANDCAPVLLLQTEIPACPKLSA